MKEHSRGVPPGWYALDQEDGGTVVVNCTDTRAVQLVQLMPKIRDGALIACFHRKLAFDPFRGGMHYVDALEFDLHGWVTTYADAEVWLQGKDPDTFVVKRGA